MSNESRRTTRREFLTRTGRSATVSALTFDGAAERFVDNEPANRRLTRAYRAPYVVPDAG